jgi:hypothetical protein
MMRVMGILLLLAAAVCQAAQTDDLRLCHENAASHPDLAIRACTAALDSERLSSADFASASYDRSIAYLHEGDFVLTLEDFIQAAGRRPSIVPLWIWIVLVAVIGQACIFWRRREAAQAESNRLQVADAPHFQDADAPRFRNAEEPALKDLEADGETLPAPIAETPPEMVVAEVFDSQHEVDLARALLESENIPTFLADEYSYRASGDVYRDLRLFVPAPLLAEAQAILHSQVSDEELTAQAEATPKKEEPPEAG